jgi:3-deoxy-D-manno-octulosonate 8-phosphate phosphatase (KDO 8-P phosphatase)
MRDGMGFERLRNAGIAVTMITGEASPIAARRAEKLQSRALLGIKDKAACLAALILEERIEPGEIAYIGDDVNDLGAMAALSPHGLVGAPADAAPEVVRMAHYVSAKQGGHGAFRDFADWILALVTGQAGGLPQSAGQVGGHPQAASQVGGHPQAPGQAGGNGGSQ